MHGKNSYTAVHRWKKSNFFWENVATWSCPHIVYIRVLFRSIIPESTSKLWTHPLHPRHGTFRDSLEEVWRWYVVTGRVVGLGISDLVSEFVKCGRDLKLPEDPWPYFRSIGFMDFPETTKGPIFVRHKKTIWTNDHVQSCALLDYSGFTWKESLQEISRVFSQLPQGPPHGFMTSGPSPNDQTTNPGALALDEINDLELDLGLPKPWDFLNSKGLQPEGEFPWNHVSSPNIRHPVASSCWGFSM